MKIRKSQIKEVVEEILNEELLDFDPIDADELRDLLKKEGGHSKVILEVKGKRARLAKMETGPKGVILSDRKD